MATVVEAPTGVQSKVSTLPKKKTAPKKSSDHPTYMVMIKESIQSLKERNGSSRQAILTYIMKTYRLTDQNKVNAQLKVALKRGVLANNLKQVKGTGASGSFKLADPVAVKTPTKKSAPKSSSKAITATAKKAPKPKKTAESSGRKSTAASTNVAKPNKSPAQSAAKKPSTKKTPTKKATTKKGTTKRSAEKKSPAKKPAAKGKKTPAKK